MRRLAVLLAASSWAWPSFAGEPPALDQLRAAAGGPAAEAPAPGDVQAASNRGMGWAGLALYRLSPGRAEVMAELEAIEAGEAVPRDLSRDIGVSGGQHKIFPRVPPGTCVGTGGAGPCVGLILFHPGSRSAVVAHFGATDDPYATLSTLHIPDGTRAAVFGGDGSGPSNATLGSVMAFLRRERRAGRLAIDGFSDSSGLWVDSEGRYGYRRYGQIEDRR